MRSTHRILAAMLAFSLGMSAVPASALNYPPISSVTFADSQTGYLGGQYGNSPRHGFLSVTSDGGATWHAVGMDNVSPAGIAVTSASMVFAASGDDDLVLATTDSGTSWTRVTPIAGTGATFSDVAATVGGGVIAVGTRVGTEDGDVAIIYTSANGSAPWTKRLAGPIYPWPVDGNGDHVGDRPQTYAKMGQIAMAPGGTVGWAFGAEWGAPTYDTANWTGLLIRKTVDGGSSWTTVTPVPTTSYALSDAVAIDATHAYAVGPARMLIKTVDGVNWTKPDLPKLGNPTIGPSLDAYGVAATDANHVVAVGLTSTGSAAVQWTADGGANWSSYIAAGFPALRSVSMITATKWMVVGDNETIGRTSDAGATWTFTQATPPVVEVTAPAASATLLTTATVVSGTSADVGVGVAAVDVSVKREDGAYWNGTGWVAGPTVIWNRASTLNGWDSWAWNWVLEPNQTGSHTYSVSARATDAFGQLSPVSTKAGIKVGYTVKTLPTVGTPIAPAVMYKTTSYSIWGTLTPRHASGTYPVRIYKYRYVNGTWVSYGYQRADVVNYSSYSKYSVKIRLPYAGRWRLRAYAPEDAAHLAALSPGFDYVTVK